MVRVTGQTSTMDNREDLLDALNDFTRKQPKEIPPLLEQYLKQVAKTGETLFPWTQLKGLFVAKIEQVMQQFSDEFGSDHIPPCPNVENARFEVYRQRIMEAVHRFHGAPFTVQRLCELLTDPKRHYKRCDKFMRGLEKNVLVVSTVDPFGKKVVSEGKVMVNGMDSNNSASPTSEDAPTTSSTPAVPTWNTSGPSTIWPLGVEGAANDVTTSSMLLEVSETPGPCDASSVSTLTSAAETSTSKAGAAVASDVISLGAENGSDSASPTVTVNSAESDHSASSEAAALSEVETGPDGSVQQVAAEEMVTEEEVAVPSAQDTVVDTVVHESVVETSPVEPGEATAPTDGAESTSSGSSDWPANTEESDAATNGTPEKSEEVESSVADSATSSAVGAQHTEESPDESPLRDKSAEAQADSSSAESQSGTAEETSSITDAEEVCSSQQENQMKDTQCESSVVDTETVAPSEMSGTEPPTSAVSSSEDASAATDDSQSESAQGSETMDTPIESSTTTSNDESKTDGGASEVLMMDADSADSSNSASEKSEVEKADSVSAEDTTQPEAEPVSISSHEAMEQD